MTLKNTFQALVYGLKLPYITLSEYYYCKKTLKKLFLQFLTPKEYKELKPYLTNLYFNCGITAPLFYEYRKLVKNEDKYARELSLLLFATIDLEDILIDDCGSNLNNLRNLFRNSGTFKPASKLEELLGKLYRYTISKVPEVNRQQQLELILSLHDAQVEGALKRVTGISFPELRKLDFDKGVWFAASVFPFDQAMSRQKINSLKHVGCWMKYIDDLYDQKKDKIYGELSLFTFPDFEDRSMKFFHDYGNLVLHVLRNLPYPTDDKNRYIFRMRFMTRLSEFFYRHVLKLLGR